MQILQPDFGLTPACIIGQHTDTGQCRIIWELTSDDMNVVEFARDVVKPFLQKHFNDWEIGFSYGDPSGNARGEGEGKSSINLLNDVYILYGDNGKPLPGQEPLKMGFVTEEAPTNDPTLRIAAVQGFMTKLCGGGEPGYLLNRACETLRKGHLGSYHMKIIRSIGGGDDIRYKETPDKNLFSHPADAEQYLCLGFQGGYVQDGSDDEYDDYEPPRKAGSMGY